MSPSTCHRGPKMNATLALRMTSIISLLLTAGHTLGGRSSWSPGGETATLLAMRSFHMNVLGVSRSYHDFYIGFGYSLSVSLLLQTVLLWQLAGLARTQPETVRPFLVAFLLATLASAIVAWELLFPIPVAFLLVVAAGLAWSYYLARPKMAPAA
jgi:hypothetical protein